MNASKSAISGATPLGSKSVHTGYNPNNNVYRSHSVDSQMTSLSGGSDLTTASQHVSEDGIDNAIKISSRHHASASIEQLAGLPSPKADKSKSKSHLHGTGSSGGGAGPAGGTGQVPVCTLCDAAASDFSCHACGGLTFCERCALSLHTNKFLGSHSLENILDPNDKVLGSDLAVRRASIDAERVAREVYSDDARAARRQAEDESLRQTLRIAESSGREKAKEEEERRRQRELRELREGPRLDMKALAGDRSVLTARGKELRSCVDILRRLSLRLAEEQASCIDATRTAGDAIRKKFDVLRNLINQKEAQFLGVVQDAGKSRHEAAVSQRTAVAAAVAETTAFVDNLEHQLQRLDGNHAMFDESRAGLLEDTRLKISHVDGLIHKFEGVVQEVRDIPLGVVVPVDGIVTALQMLHPPERTISSAEVAMLNAAEALHPVPADNFENALGVKHFRSGGAAADDYQYNATSRSNNSPWKRAPLTSSATASSSASFANSRPAPFEIRQVLPSAASSSAAAGSLRTSSPAAMSASSRPQFVGNGMPSEVRELRKHLQMASSGSGNTGGGGGGGSRPSSPSTAAARRTSSPLVQQRRSGSPMSVVVQPQRVSGNLYLNSSQMSAGGGGGIVGGGVWNNNTSNSYGRNTPGPGSYHVAYPLSSRNGPLSTPPRRPGSNTGYR